MERIKQTLDTLYEAPDGKPMTMRWGIEKGLMFCEYAAACTRKATATIAHPIIGDLPICQTHKEFYEK